MYSRVTLFSCSLQLVRLSYCYSSILFVLLLDIFDINNNKSVKVPKNKILLYFWRIFPKKESGYITGKMPAKMLRVLVKYRQAAREAKSVIVMIISEDPCNCIVREPT